MDDGQSNEMLAVLAFAGAIVSGVGLLAAVLTADVVFATVALAGSAYCGGIWAWYVAGPLDVPRP